MNSLLFFFFLNTSPLLVQRLRFSRRCLLFTFTLPYLPPHVAFAHRSKRVDRIKHSIYCRSVRLLKCTTGIEVGEHEEAAEEDGEYLASDLI